MPEPRRIRIAIAGGGIAGATLLYALRQDTHLDVHIFEAAPKFREGGASVGIHHNAYRALELISPEAVACLDAAGAFKLDGFTAAMAVGEDQGRTVAMVGEEGGKCVEHVVRSVSREAMLRMLLADAPPLSMHTSKQVLRYEMRSDGSLRLHLYVGPRLQTRNCKPQPPESCDAGDMNILIFNLTTNDCYEIVWLSEVAQGTNLVTARIRQFMTAISSSVRTASVAPFAN